MHLVYIVTLGDHSRAQTIPLWPSERALGMRREGLLFDKAKIQSKETEEKKEEEGREWSERESPSPKTHPETRKEKLLTPGASSRGVSTESSRRRKSG